MLGTTVSGYLLHALQPGYRRKIDDVSILLCLHQRYNMPAGMVDAIYIHFKYFVEPLKAHLIKITKISQACIINQYMNLLSQQFFCFEKGLLYVIYITYVRRNKVEVGMFI